MHDVLREGKDMAYLLGVIALVVSFGTLVAIIRVRDRNFKLWVDKDREELERIIKEVHGG